MLARRTATTLCANSVLALGGKRSAFDYPRPSPSCGNSEYSTFSGGDSKHGPYLDRAEAGAWRGPPRDQNQLVSALSASGKCSRVASRDTRREENQKLFRMGNERLSAAVDEQEFPQTASVPFLCECADEFCDGKVELDRTQWQSIASNPNEYVMVPGHPRSEGEVVVGALDGYDVVRKPD